MYNLAKTVRKGIEIFITTFFFFFRIKPVVLFAMVNGLAFHFVVVIGTVFHKCTCIFQVRENPG